MRRSDPDTWTPEDGWLGSETNGIIANCGIGQAPFMWRLRLLPKVTEAFAAIWGCAEDELLTSFDGANVFRPWRRDPSWITKGGWYHVDQNAFNPGKAERCCIQGQYF